MTLRAKLPAAISGLALLVAGGASAIAQDAGDVAVPAPPEMAMPATEFSEAQIKAFALAYVQVMEIGTSYEQQAQTAESSEDATALQMQAQQEMVTAVEGVDGISVDEYNALLTTAQTDQALAQQVQDEVDALMVE